MTTSLLSEWTSVVIDLPNAPSSNDLTLSFRALNNSVYGRPARASWDIVRTDLPESNKVVTVGIKDSSSQHAVEFGTIGFASVQEYGEYGLETEVRQEYVLSPEPFLDPVADLVITLTPDGAVAFLLNGVSGLVWVPLLPEIFAGPRTVTLYSADFLGYDDKQTSINELDSFSISSGAAGNAKFWTNFVQSFEVP